MSSWLLKCGNQPVTGAPQPSLTAPKWLKNPAREMSKKKNMRLNSRPRRKRSLVGCFLIQTIKCKLSCLKSHKFVIVISFYLCVFFSSRAIMPQTVSASVLLLTPPAQWSPSQDLNSIYMNMTETSLTAKTLPSLM